MLTRRLFASTTAMLAPVALTSSSSSSMLTMSMRSYCTPAAASTDKAHLQAMEVAMTVNKMKRAHQTNQSDRKTLEREAWAALNTLTEEQINNAEGKAVALLLNSWAYFSKSWEKGKEGPLDAQQ